MNSSRQITRKGPCFYSFSFLFFFIHRTEVRGSCCVYVTGCSSLRSGNERGETSCARLHGKDDIYIYIYAILHVLSLYLAHEPYIRFVGHFTKFQCRWQASFSHPLSLQWRSRGVGGINKLVVDRPVARHHLSDVTRRPIQPPLLHNYALDSLS